MDALHARVAEVLERAEAAMDAGSIGGGAADGLASEIPAVRSALVERLRDGRGGPAELAEDVGALRRLGDLERSLEDRVGDPRFTALERIHSALARLRELPSVEALIPAAAEELARACGFDRAVVSRLRGATWRAEAVWMAPHLDGAVSAATREYLTRDWIPLGPKALEKDLIRRRTADLVAAGDERTTAELMAVSRSRGYVAAPVMPTGRVIGFLQADCVARDVTMADRDHLWTFAEGFGLVFEHTALLQRIGDQRARVLRAFGAAERALSGLSVTGAPLSGRPVPPDPARDRPPDGSLIEHLLSPREREIVELLASGARNAEIATQLVISETTVKSHVRAVTRKLRASSRADAVSRYLRLRAGGAP